MGGLGLRADLRWLPALGRARRRPLRAPHGLYGRARALPRDLAPGGVVDVLRDAHRRAAAPGRRGRDPLAVGLFDHARDVPGRRRTEQGARDPRRHRRVGRRDRRAHGRRLHAVRELGVDLLRQHPDCRDRPRPRPALRAREQGRGPGAPLRLVRRRHGDGQPHAPRLRAHAGEPGGLGLGPDDRRVRRFGRADGGLPVERNEVALAARPALDLQAPHAHRRERDRLRPGDDDLRDVLPALALHAAGAGLLGHGDRLRLSRGRADRHRRGHDLPGPRHQAGRQARAGGRNGPAHGRARLLHPGVGRRLVCGRPAARLPDHRRRHGLFVRADLDRRPRGRSRGRRPALRPGSSTRASRSAARSALPS